MKHYKEFLSEMSEEMIDAEVSVYPTNLKYDAKHKLSSFDTKIILTLDNNKQIELKSNHLKLAFLSYMSYASVKKSILTNPEAMLFSTEVYTSADLKKGIQMYIYLGNKKVPITN